MSRSSLRKDTNADGALSIAAATAILRGLLQGGLAGARAASHLQSDIAVTSQPPDRIQLGTEERPQLNLFLFHLEPASALPALRWGDSRPSDAAPLPMPALGLELHYLLTAYGAQDLEAELLLAHALRLIHAHAELTGEEVERRLASAVADASYGAGAGSPGAAARQSLVRSDLAAQLAARRSRPLRLTLQFPSLEEMSRLWGMLQAPYRPSVVVRLDAVFIPSAEPETPR